VKSVILADGLEPDLRTVLQNIGVANALTMDRPTLERSLDNNKTRYAAELAKQMAASATLAQRMLQTFRDAITALRGLT
jgi:hypothetical protein